MIRLIGPSKMCTVVVASSANKMFKSIIINCGGVTVRSFNVSSFMIDALKIRQKEVVKNDIGYLHVVYGRANRFYEALGQFRQKIQHLF